MDWTEIDAYLQTVVRPRRKFTILPCQQELSRMVRWKPKPITYDDLIRENFEDKSKLLVPIFDDLTGNYGSDALAFYLPFHGNINWGIPIGIGQY